MGRQHHSKTGSWPHSGTRSQKYARRTSKDDTSQYMYNTEFQHSSFLGTYSSSFTGANLVRQTARKAWVTHEDGRLDHLDRRRGERDRGRSDALGRVTTAAEGVVHDLSSLRVPDQHDRRVRTLLVEGIDGTGDGGNALFGRVGVADSAAGRLAAACWVVDSLGRRAGIGLCDEVGDRAGGAVARRGCRLAGREDVDTRAGLASLYLGERVS